MTSTFFIVTGDNRHTNSPLEVARQHFDQGAHSDPFPAHLYSWQHLGAPTTLRGMSWLESVDLKFFRFINLELRHPALDALMPQFASNDWFFPAVILLAIGLIWKGGTRGRLLVLMLGLI